MRKKQTIAKEVMICGFEVPLPYMIGPWCAARHHYAWMIGPDGNIYKCLSDFGRQKSIVEGLLILYADKFLQGDR